jgi:DNA-binding NtrC family response regulator
MGESVNVLILDDEPIVGKRLKPALAKIDCEVDAFVDPRAALEALEKKEYDIVVTDIRMDDIDGLEVLGRVKEKWPRTKVIMITGYAMMDLAREAMAMGAFDFISKPFRPEDLRQAITKAVAELREPSGD